MTKLRTPLSFEDALVQVAGALGGFEPCAKLLDCSDRTVRNWSDPDTAAKISIHDALRLGVAFKAATGEEDPFLIAYAGQLKAEVATATFSADVLLRTGAAAAKESGEAVAAVFEAARPGAGIAERTVAKRELRESIAAQQRALATLDDEGGPEVSPPASGRLDTS
jgi:hypothetical protein